MKYKPPRSVAIFFMTIFYKLVGIAPLPPPPGSATGVEGGGLAIKFFAFMADFKHAVYLNHVQVQSHSDSAPPDSPLLYSLSSS